MPARPVSDATWSTAVLEADLPVLVEITAAWNATGDITARAVDRLADQAQGRLVVLRLDVDANPLTVRRYAVTSIPTILVIEQGRVARRLVGTCTFRRLREDVADYLTDLSHPPGDRGASSSTPDVTPG